MRILLLNYEYPPLGGGGGVAAKQLAEGFVENGHQVAMQPLIIGTGEVVRN